MAKENKLKPGILFCIAVVLLSAGFLMKSFPVLIFAGLAPLMSITDQVKVDKFWNLIELILIALFVGFWSSHAFNKDTIVISLLLAIAFSFAFMGQSFFVQKTGLQLGKLPLIAFWLTIEYIFVNLPGLEKLIYLGDSISLKTDWLSWTQDTGYSGLTLWILVINLALYSGLFMEGKVNWYFIACFFLLIAGPMVYSYLKSGEGATRMSMLAEYEKNDSTHKNFIQRGEVIHKVSAGISLILLAAALLKNKTSER